jgi:formylglycine-generating enzyme required for sulfatase activity
MRHVLFFLLASPAILALGWPSTDALRVHAQQVSAGNPASIPAGAFSMGTDTREVPTLLARYRTSHAELFLTETPRRTIHVEAFRLDRTEVTKAQFALFLRARPEWAKEAVPAAAHNGQYLAGWEKDRFPAGESARPVAFITWPAATAYCAWAEGRLPTESDPLQRQPPRRRCGGACRLPLRICRPDGRLPT